MGFGLPAAIGAKLARPDREVWAIVGDGGFQMTQAELQTMVQENVKVNVAIINNGYLGMVRQWQQFFHDRRYSATPMSSPDYVKLADAHGLPGVRVTRRGDMADALAARARLGRRGGDGFPRRAGRHGLPDGVARRGAARHDQAPRARSSLAETGADLCSDRRTRPRRAPSSSATSTRSTRSIASPGSCGGSGCAPKPSPAVASHDRATVQATIMFDSSDKTAAQHRVAARAADRRAGSRRLDVGKPIKRPDKGPQTWRR